MNLSYAKKTMLLVLVALAAGTGLVFRRGPCALGPAGDDAHKTLTRRLPNSRSAGEHGQLLQAFEERVPRLPTAATVDPDAGGRDFAAHPSRNFHPAGGLFEPIENLPAQPAGEQLLADARADGGADVEPRMHVVVDGDTLAKLAARYLGSSDRYAEIFAANRLILSTPNLLPIGTRLMIPPRQRPAPPAQLGPDDQTSLSRPSEDSPLRLDFDAPATENMTRPEFNASAGAAIDSEVGPVLK